MDVLEKLFSLATDDYQNRGNNYPKSDIPDTIDVYNESEEGTYGVHASFKNTSEDDAQYWLRNYLERNGFNVDNVYAYQTGDYHDDWVDAEAVVRLS